LNIGASKAKRAKWACHVEYALTDCPERAR
jgi:hypothetical protein